MLYEYLKIKKVGELPEGEKEYDVNRIGAETIEELAEKKVALLSQGYEVATEEEWVDDSTPVIEHVVTAEDIINNEGAGLVEDEVIGIPIVDEPKNAESV